MNPLQWARRAIERLSPGQCIALFTFINILNYLDRGIVPGAFDSLGDFIREDLQTQNTDVQLGLLQSMYIVGYAVASVSFGRLVHSYPPFHLMAIGLGVWVFAVLLSGWAPHFWVLVLARVFSGVGEASFQTIVPPYIDDKAPPAKRGLWLSLFFSAIPVGTAVGYAWGGNIATALSWRWAFFLEAIPMAPLAVIVFFIPYGNGGGGPGVEDGKGVGDTTPPDDDAAAVTPPPSRRKPVDDGSPNPLRTPRSEEGAEGVGGIDIDAELALALGEEEEGGGGGGGGFTPRRPSSSRRGARQTFLEELAGVVTEPIYMSIVLGYAGYTAVLAGMGSFGPTITKGLGLFNDQATASLYFGGAVSFAGAIGTPLGGYLIDLATRRRKRREAEAGAAAGAVQAVAAGALAGGVSPSTLRAATAKVMLDSPGGVGVDASLGAAGVVGQPDAAPPQPLAAEEEEGDDAHSRDKKLVIALPQAVWATMFGTVACMGGIMVGKESGGLFFTLLGAGALALCTTTAGINQSIMASVRPESRSFAIGLGTLLLHALGDVPAPPVIGAIADQLSPQTCGGSGATPKLDGLALLGDRHAGLARALASALSSLSSSPPPPLPVSDGGGGGGSGGGSPPPPPHALVGSTDCTRDAYGLQVTLVITLAWLVWPILLWGAGWVLTSRRMARREAALAGLGTLDGEGQLKYGFGSGVGMTRGLGDGEGVTALLSADRSSVARGAVTSPRAHSRDWDGRVLLPHSANNAVHVELRDA